MRRSQTRFLHWLLAPFAAIALVSCAAGPPPREIAEARLAVQDAKNAGADQRATRQYDAAVAHLNVAQAAWNEKKEAETAAHWARLAEGEARDAQYRAETLKAEEDLRRETERRARGELAVRDAEIGALQGEARAEAEKRAAEAEARARSEAQARAAEQQRGLQEELARREAAARESERIRAEAEAKLAAERERADREAAQRSQAERDRAAAEQERMRAELEKSREAADEARKAAEVARQAADAERQRLEQQRQAEQSRADELTRLAQEQEKTREELRATLSRLAQVREEARGLIVTLPGSIYFDVNKSDVKPAMRNRLTEIAQALGKVPGQRVLIEGHTDSDGSDDYNLQLSQLRAQSVRSILIAGGVTPERIEARGYGETKPVATNANASGKAQNRRVELVLEGSAAAPTQ